LFKSEALSNSLKKLGFETITLIVDEETTKEDIKYLNKNCLTIKDLPEKDIKLILSKYRNNNDKLRWAIKPVLLKYLLDLKFENVLYVDNDIYFFSSPLFLFEKLKSNNILLTPHFYLSDPLRNQNWLEASYRVGLYNAGFIGVNKKAISMLEWWKNCCIYNIKKSYWRGLYDDQKYLDLVPILFENVEVLKDTGCNLAGWNYENRMLKLGEGNLSSITFVHFAELTMKEFSKSENPFYPLYKEYLMIIRSLNSSFKLEDKKYSKRNILAYFYFLIWKLARKFD
jgi:hypothetical protein